MPSLADLLCLLEVFASPLNIPHPLLVKDENYEDRKKTVFKMAGVYFYRRSS
jgi:hypothetical protein